MNLVDRVKRILLSPRTEWEVIDAEQTTPAALYTGYIAPLAAIGPIAQLIGFSVFGIPLPLRGTYRVPFGSALTGAIISYVLSLVVIYLLALIIDALAPTFSGQRNQIQALKVAAYSSTAAWVAGIFALIPWLGFLGIVGLYSLYLLYLGLPVLMKAPREKAVPYTAVVILAAIVLFVVVGMIAGRFTGMRYAGMAMS
jgi:Yip1 domain